MKHIIIGTAGHVDHGKTTLIQKLTGTNPDRLKEEQERGMTIDIGFASLTLPEGTIAGIVDVPGHERFLKNMLAGATGVDVVLLVVAADESVMPQTVEHLDILRLLDVKNGVVALTKCDMVDREWTDAVEEDIREQLKDTFLAQSPIVRVSSTTGKGIDALKRALLSAVSKAEARNASLPFRLPIDRVFTRTGFGTVVTGTLTAGTIHVGDALEILPQKTASRVRGLQVHGQKVSLAEAGSRVAINIAGVDTDAIERGAQIAAPGISNPTRVFDATFRLLPRLAKPFKDRMRVRVHLGTAEILGRIRLLDHHSELAPGERAYVQFRAEEDFACMRGDRFVVRTYSPMRTIGGGIVLDPDPPRHRKDNAETLNSLAAKERGTPEDLIQTQIQRFPFGLTRRDLIAQSGLTPQATEAALDALVQMERVVLITPNRVIDAALLRSLTDRATHTLQSYHTQLPLRPGMPKEELRSSFARDLENRVFTTLLSFWQERDLIITEGASVRNASFRVTLNERQQTLLHRIEEFYLQCGMAMPVIEDVVNAVHAPQDAVRALLLVAVERGDFHRLADDQYYHADTIRQLQALVEQYVKEHGTITVSAFRDITKSNRRFSLAILEYFDQIRFTFRQGDERTITAETTD